MKDRVIPIAKETCEWLERWEAKRTELGLNGRHPFFPVIRDSSNKTGMKGARLTPRAIQQAIGLLAKKAQIEQGVHPHTLRHTYATHLLNSHFNLREVQQLLGHSTVGTTEIYCHVNPTDLRDKIQNRQPVDSRVQELARQLAGLPDDARQALAELLRQSE